MTRRGSNQYRSQTMRLWHGTARCHLDSIYEQGLRDPYLTDDPDVAWYYAEQEAEDTGTDPVIVTVDVDTDRLRYDAAAMDEPVMTDEDDRNDAWDDAVAAHPEWVHPPGTICVPDTAWDVSLRGAASVKASGVVPAVTHADNRSELGW